MIESNKALIYRLARIEGQVRALKTALSGNAEVDCIQTLLQVKAATNGLKRFAKALARERLGRCVTDTRKTARLAQELDEILSTAFTLS